MLEQVGLNIWTDSFLELQHLHTGLLGHGIEFDGGASYTDIQLHSSKGANVYELILNNISISAIKNYANLDADGCGDYSVPDVSNEDGDIQYGYTWTRAQWIAIDYAMNVTMNDININNIESFYGEANGIVIYKKCMYSLHILVLD